MSKPIYNPNKPYSADINDLIQEDLIEKGKALPVGTMRTWGGQDYIKHADGWVHVSSGKLTSGKKMEPVESHANASQHAEAAAKHREEKAKQSGKDAKANMDPSKMEESSRAQKKAKEEGTKAKLSGMTSEQKDKLIQENDKKIKENSPKMNSDMSMKEDPKQVSSQEKAALAEYQSGMHNSALGGYANINGFLRDGKPKFGKYTPDEEKLVEEVAKNVSSAIQKHPVKGPMTVYRGLKIDKESTALLDQYMKAKPGDVITDKGFTSASKDRKVADKFSEKLNRGDNQVVITINLKDGDFALPMDDYHKHGSEKEMLLDRNTKFKVVSSQNKMGVLHLTLEIQSKSESKLAELRDQYKAEGQKHAAKVVDKKMKEMATPKGPTEKDIPKYPEFAVFDSEEGTMNISIRNGKFYADIGNKYDLERNTWAEMEKVIKQNKGKLIGYDKDSSY